MIHYEIYFDILYNLIELGKNTFIFLKFAKHSHIFCVYFVRLEKEVNVVINLFPWKIKTSALQQKHSKPNESFVDFRFVFATIS